MKGKVILFGPYPPPYGGVAVYIYTLNKYLTQFGLDCQLKICKQNDSSNDLVRPNFRSVYNNFREITKNDICVDSSGFFLEYIEYSRRSPFLAWVLLKLLKRFKWIKVVHDGSLPSRYEKFEFKRKLLFHLLIRFVDEFIVVSEDLSNWFKNEIGVKQNVSFIKSLLPITPQPFDAALPSEIEKTISHHTKIVCSIGVFTPAYGFKYIADAVERLRYETRLDIGLILIDGAFAVDDENCRGYKREVLGQREWITVLTSIPHPQVLQIFKKSNVFVRGVAFESYGLSRVEALWCGIPVVATRVGETRGMLLYDYGDENELIRQMKEALFNPSMQDISIWAERFRKEAEDNLQALVRVINPKREISFD